MAINNDFNIGDEVVFFNEFSKECEGGVIEYKNDNFAIVDVSHFSILDINYELLTINKIV